MKAYLTFLAFSNFSCSYFVGSLTASLNFLYLSLQVKLLSLVISENFLVTVPTGLVLTFPTKFAGISLSLLFDLNNLPIISNNANAASPYKADTGIFPGIFATSDTAFFIE